MFYGKELKAIKTKRVRLLFTDFSKGINTYINEDLLPQQYASMAYNFCSESGALKNAKGIDRLMLNNGQAMASLNSNILKLYFYKRYDPDSKKYDDKLLAYCENKKLYYADINGEDTIFKEIVGVEFAMPPSGINYRLNGDDVIILCSEKDYMTVWDGKNQPYIVETAPHISTMCVHYERLFATVDGEKSALWFSDDLDPTNWDISLEEAGFIEISDDKGSLLKVLKFLDYIYIFRSYGITRLTAYSMQTEFSVVPLFVSSGKIYPDTVCVCGDRIIFLAEDGLYAFDGLSTQRILDSVYPLFESCDNSKAVSAYYNGCYYIACNLNYKTKSGDTYINNTLLEYNISFGAVNLIKGADISCLTVISTENFSTLAISLRGTKGGQAAMLCSENRLFEKPLLKCWTTPRTDLSYPDKVKLIKEIYVNTQTDIRIAVTTDLMSKIIFIGGGKGTKCAAVNIRGTAVQLSFFCNDSKACISRPMIIADIL